MPASMKSIREDTDIRPTPEDKGLLMTITVTAYDSGLVKVDEALPRIPGAAPRHPP